MGAVEVQRFLERAEDFLGGMQLLRGDVAYLNSSALLGIHSAVSYTDALRVGLGETNLAAADHQVATKSLRRLLSTRLTGTDNGLRHLELLVSKKNVVAYGARRFAAEDYEALFTQAERFAKWANLTGRRLNIKGWNYGDE